MRAQELLTARDAAERSHGEKQIPRLPSRRAGGQTRNDKVWGVNTKQARQGLRGTACHSGQAVMPVLLEKRQ